jgi:hypothetical protein
MEAKKKGFAQVTQQEIELLEKLRKHPEIRERVRKVLEIATDEGSNLTADQVEELLIEEMRKLGNATMHGWAGRADEQASQQLQSKEPTVVKRKKKR